MQKQSGFTLIEMMMTVAIIGILSATALPMVLNYRLKAFDTLAHTNLRQLMGFEELYFSTHFNYVPMPNIGLGPRIVNVTSTDNFIVADRTHLEVVLATAANGLPSYNAWARHQQGTHTYMLTGSIGTIYFVGGN
ncbi:MAG: prepilin-type N-terminal cleavage/methylation domain-containing protein [Mariprofundales bacterium]